MWLKRRRAAALVLNAPWARMLLAVETNVLDVLLAISRRSRRRLVKKVRDVLAPESLPTSRGLGELPPSHNFNSNSRRSFVAISLRWLFVYAEAVDLPIPSARSA
jgi:hypothetical protein